MASFGMLFPLLLVTACRATNTKDSGPAVSGLRSSAVSEMPSASAAAPPSSSPVDPIADRILAPQRRLLTSPSGAVTLRFAREDLSHATRIYIRAQTEPTERLLFDLADHWRPGAAVYLPQFSPDERLLYFLTDEAVAARGLLSLELSTGKTRTLQQSNALTVITSCSDARWLGHLIIRPHHVDVFGMPIPLIEPLRPLDWYFLMKPDGVVVGPVGDESTFLAKRCGVSSGEISGRVDQQPLPKALPRPVVYVRAFLCEGKRGDVYRAHFLDGSTQVIYHVPYSYAQGFYELTGESAKQTLAASCPDAWRDVE